MSKKKDITASRLTFRPFEYEWAYDKWLAHEQAHWSHLEVPMHEDIKDFQQKLSTDEREFLTKILRFFVQGDIDIGGSYLDYYIPNFRQPEVRMMMSGFAARESLHVAAYAHLIETLSLPESIYNEFLQYKEMVEKHEYLEKVKDMGMLEKIACISAFGEGMQLFSSFVMLLNFARHGKMKGLGQIISWSIQDENLHAEGMIEVFREYAKQNRKTLWNDETKSRIYNIAKEMVDLEDKFLDLAFGMLKVEGLTKEEVKEYIRYIADGRLISLGLKPIYGIEENPLFWVETMLGASHTNFFEQQVTDYAKGTLTGSWADVWGQAK